MGFPLAAVTTEVPPEGRLRCLCPKVLEVPVWLEWPRRGCRSGPQPMSTSSRDSLAFRPLAPWCRQSPPSLRRMPWRVGAQAVGQTDLDLASSGLKHDPRFFDLWGLLIYSFCTEYGPACSASSLPKQRRPTACPAPALRPFRARPSWGAGTEISHLD